MNKLLIKNRILVLILLVTFVAAPLTVSAGEEVKRFKMPDIKDDFCGVEINYQYCKCAFHDKFCENIGLDKKAANTYVQSEYKKWITKNLALFASNCMYNQNGIWNKNKRTCTTCTPPHVNINGKCTKTDKDKELPEGPFNEDCSVNQTKFNKDWKKYSDFGGAISINEASWEVQQYNKVLDKIADRIVRADQIEYDMEIDRLLRLELRDYKQSLVRNIRSNLTKAMFRLAWMTYNTAKGVKGTQQSYSKLFTAERSVEKIGAAFKFIQSGVPKGSKAEIDTKARRGTVKSIALNATLEALESGGNPKDIALQVYKDLTGATMASVGVPSLEFTTEEIGILRDQHLTNRAIDEILADSYRENAMRRIELLELKKEIAELYNELQEWKSKEYSRVKNSLEQSCKDQINKSKE